MLGLSLDDAHYYLDGLVESLLLVRNVAALAVVLVTLLLLQHQATLAVSLAGRLVAGYVSTLYRLSSGHPSMPQGS